MAFESPGPYGPTSAYSGVAGPVKAVEQGWNCRARRVRILVEIRRTLPDTAEIRRRRTDEEPESYIRMTAPSHDARGPSPVGIATRSVAHSPDQDRHAMRQGVQKTLSRYWSENVNIRPMARERARVVFVGGVLCSEHLGVENQVQGIGRAGR